MPGTQIQGITESGVSVPLKLSDDGKIIISNAATSSQDGWESVSVSGRTRDTSKDLVQNFGDGTVQTIYFTTDGEYAGMSARAAP